MSGAAQDSQVHDRVKREQSYFDGLVRKGWSAHRLLERITEEYYNKGRRGRIWGPIWEEIDMRGALVLDYGCGDGAFSYLVAGLGAKVWGIDISPELIAKARAVKPTPGRSQPEFLVGDAHRTPFPDNSFDFVVGNGAIHHLDLDRAYAEIARVLKPGGRAFFMEPMYNHPFVWLFRRCTPSLRSSDERPLSFSEIERARQWFRRCSHREHYLLAVFAAPMHLLGKNAALVTIGWIDRLDQIFLRLLPPLRWFAWMTMMEMEK